MPALPPDAPSPAAVRPASNDRSDASHEQLSDLLSDGGGHTAPLPAAAVLPSWPLLRATLVLACGALVVAMLVVGEALLVPLALATLLAFVLEPLVTRLQRWRVPRAAAVVLVLASLGALVASASVFIAGQAVVLGRELPTYQSTVQAKLRAVRQQLSGRGPLDDVSRLLDVVGSELDATRRSLAHTAAPAKATTQRVVLATPEPTAMQALQQLAAPLLGPVGTAGLVAVFLLFLLLEWHDLRDRLLRLAGGELHRSTEALGEAGDRVSRYLGMQVLVNLGYAVPLAVGLWALGVPGALLFGAVGGLLRFVPYIGPLVAAVFPLAMAFAVDPGWQMLLGTLALVLLLELVINNLVEPWLYGASTGLAPTAVVVSAAFWTLLWGPVGLILATPLTVCLVVMGRHLPRLQWLDVMLGNDPVFDPPTRLYQRLLDGEVEEAVELALADASGHAFQATCNDTVVPVLALVADNQHRMVSAEQRLRLVQGLGLVLQELRAHAAPATGAALADQPAQVLCAGLRSEVDVLAAQLLVQALGQHGLPAGALAGGALGAHRIDALALGAARLLVLCSLARRPDAQLRVVARRLQRLHPGLQVVLALWNPAAAPGPLGDGLDQLPLARTLDDAVLQAGAACREPAHHVPSAPPAAPTPAALQPARPDDPPANPLADPACQAPIDHVVQRAAELLAMPMACVAWAVPGGQHWAAPLGWPAALTADQVLPADLGLWPLVQAQDQAVQVADVARHPALASQPLLVACGVRGGCAVPVRLPGGSLVGALLLADRVPRLLRAPELQLLQRLADELGALAGRPPAAAQVAVPVAAAPPAPAAPRDDAPGWPLPATA